jgi:quercetin dioxygenase-like cupin family protein
MTEAPLEDNGSGLAPAGEGWFVVNVRVAQWLTSEEGEKQPTGSECYFESGKAEFPQLGFRIHVLPPGQSNGPYHGENKQEDFLVLHGECVLLVQGEERRLSAWDFVHCPPWTEHIFVGAGDGPCAILMAGARRRLAGSLPGVRVRRTPPGECGRGDVQSRSGLRRVRAVPARTTVLLAATALGLDEGSDGGRSLNLHLPRSRSGRSSTLVIHALGLAGFV